MEQGTPMEDVYYSAKEEEDNPTVDVCYAHSC
jgi:hypothetical protein